jgi:2-polyprenyl-6-hydroxyphenyl methylase/3-demethylubiquinone-9 3-methyltransferase
MTVLSRSSVNNDFYDTLGERWYEAHDDPVALLRAESRARRPWILARLRDYEREFSSKPRILDLACGAGFLSNALGEAGYDVVGVDLSPESVEVAKRHDLSRRVRYLVADARRTTFDDQSFDAICAMDFLEHVAKPGEVIHEVSRLLRPGGLFFFHTFNRNLLSKLIVIKGVEWFVRNTPEKMHVSELFLKPAELDYLCAFARLNVEEMHGVRPRIFQRALLKLVLTGIVSEGFEFVFSRSLLTGYCGMARKSA